MTIKAPHSVIIGKAVSWRNTMQLHGNWILAGLVTTQRSYYECFKAAPPSRHLDHKQVNAHLLPKDVCFCVGNWTEFRMKREFLLPCTDPQYQLRVFSWQISSTFFSLWHSGKACMSEVSVIMANPEQQRLPNPDDCSKQAKESLRWV